jgi:hypothetical protein
MVAALCCWGSGAWAAPGQLVFGSFRSADNARGWAAELETRFATDFAVERVRRQDGDWYRVRTPTLEEAEGTALAARAAAAGLEVWLIRGTLETPDGVTSSAPAVVVAPASSTSPRDAGEAAPVPEARAAAADEPPAVEARPVAEARPGVAGRSSPALAEPERAGGGADVYADVDLGLQTRTYAERGSAGQDRFQPSLSARLEYHRSWEDGRSSLTFTPFLRLDAEDDERTHADLRELFLTRLGDDWELHAGFRQIFWGVTEFNHLVDIINQTDFVENIDGEDKLGQPMVQLSLVRDWGIVDVFALTGFRERTFPGEDGRLRGLPPVDADAVRYASGAGRHRVDAAVRWSHHVGPVSFGVHHFSGTGRDPRFVPNLSDGELVLIPEYHVIDQTGFDGQALVGDWAWKLEAITRSGHGDRYEAVTAGFERTLVGVLGSRADLGLVVEYMYDERDAAAFDTLFEHDVAFGTRWRANDMAGTTALLGVIWDVDTEEYVLSLEASRRLGASWEAVVEGRVFGGASPLPAGATTPALLDGEVKSRALQDDDFIQLELTRYF